MREFWRAFAHNRAAVVGLAVLTIDLVLALLAPTLYPVGPFQFVARPFLPPLGGRILGTDMLGRDLAAAMVYGARTSLLIGCIASGVAMCAGVLVGAIAGYYGGKTDDLLTHFTEVFQTIPSFIFATVLVAVLGPSIKTVVIAIAVVSWPSVARLVRGEFLILRNREFVQACVCMGLTDWRTIFRHILPNSWAPLVVAGSLIVGTAMLTEAGLSFLGLSDPNVMSWGFIVGAGRDFLRRAWWISVFPGVAIALTVLAVNLVGNGLNGVVNPRARKR